MPEPVESGLDWVRRCRLALFLHRLRDTRWWRRRVSPRLSRRRPRQLPRGREWAPWSRQDWCVCCWWAVSRRGLGSLDLIIFPTGCLVPPALIFCSRHCWRPGGWLHPWHPLGWSRRNIRQRLLPQLRVWKPLSRRLVWRVDMQARAVGLRGGSRRGRNRWISRHLPGRLVRLRGTAASTGCRGRVVRRSGYRWGGSRRTWSVAVRPWLDVHGLGSRRKLHVRTRWKPPRGHLARGREGLSLGDVVREIVQRFSLKRGDHRRGDWHVEHGLCRVETLAYGAACDGWLGVCARLGTST